MDDFFLQLVNYRYMPLMYVFLVYDRLNMFMDDWSVMFMNYILVHLFDHILMMLMDYFSVCFFDDWLLYNGFDYGCLLMCQYLSLGSICLHKRSFFMSDYSRHLNCVT